MRAPKQEVFYHDRLDIPKEYLRFTTPKEVSKYRAERLKCDILVEIGAGIGGQTFGFSKFCKKVIAIELDPKKLKILRDNIKKLGLKNVDVIDGDALSERVIKRVKELKPEIIFWDSSRKAEGERSINDLSPNIWLLLKEYSKISSKISIEIPPFTSDLKSLKENFEEEFISLDGKLNRLTLYLNELKKSDKSVVALPEKERIENKKIKESEIESSAGGYKYFYIINPAIILSGLINELASQFKVKILQISKKKYFLSNEKINSVFLQRFEILKVCKNNFLEILRNLKLFDAKKVVLRLNINPEYYWKERKKYEEQLKGKKEIHLFAGEEAVLCKYKI